MSDVPTPADFWAAVTRLVAQETYERGGTARVIKAIEAAREADRQAAAAALGQPAGDWRTAALRLGEMLATDGPTGYYATNPEAWLDWATSCLMAERALLRNTLRELVAAGEFAVACSDEVAIMLRLGHATDAANDVLDRTSTTRGPTETPPRPL